MAVWVLYVSMEQNNATTDATLTGYWGKATRHAEEEH